MSIQALSTAATGLDALQTRTDVIANNLANVNTDGFRKTRVNFEDLFYKHLRLPGARNEVAPTGLGINVGLGVRVASTQQMHQQGPLKSTGRDKDIAIVGRGFFQVQIPDIGGVNVAYTRSGHFTLNADGQMVLANAHGGKLLLPTITIPADTTTLQINPDGTVMVAQSGSTTMTQIGQIELADFPNPEGLLPVGENLFLESEASGSPITATPGTGSTGQVRQNTLEGSNVDPVRELVDLISTQRAFELNSQVIQSADESLKVIANLRR